MTGGIVVVLGRAGRNFGAGMSNGVAYVIDEAGTFETRVNQDMVELGELDEADLALLQRPDPRAREKTASPRARRILVQWDHFVPLFWKVRAEGRRGAGGRRARRLPAVGERGSGAGPGASQRLGASSCAERRIGLRMRWARAHSTTDPILRSAQDDAGLPPCRLRAQRITCWTASKPTKDY